MELWQEEALRLERLENMPRPRCVCCGEAVTSEKCLDLSAFGLRGFGCERCVDANMEFTMDRYEQTRLWPSGA